MRRPHNTGMSHITRLLKVKNINKPCLALSFPLVIDKILRKERYRIKWNVEQKGSHAAVYK